MVPWESRDQRIVLRSRGAMGRVGYEIVFVVGQGNCVWGRAGKWRHEISPGDVEELVEHHADERGYLDRKWTYLGNHDDGPIVFDLKGAAHDNL